MKQSLMQLTMDELKQALVQMGEKAFRAEQVFGWLHKGVAFQDMRNLPLSLREKLAENYLDNPVKILRKIRSKIDGTQKFLFLLPDGQCIEGVLMQYQHGATLCVSTQVGCRMGCVFCASTLEGCVRNVTAAEMLGQVHLANQVMGSQKVHNIVLMGSGEPLDNYDHTIRFLRLVSHDKGLNIGIRHISVSTCGLVKEMKQLAHEGLQVTLSLSLHACDDAVRRAIMPIANKYSIKETLEACKYYIEHTGRRVIIEYALIKDKNDSAQEATKLAGLLRNMQCHVNVIPLNPVKERALDTVSEDGVQVFINTLHQLHISATRRREMGDDIQGACGQLRRSYLQEEKEGNQ